MTALLIAATVSVALVMRFGVLLKERNATDLTALFGALIVSGLWGYIAAVAATVLMPSLSPAALVAVAAFTGYIGDRRAFATLRGVLSGRGLEIADETKIAA